MSQTEMRCIVVGKTGNGKSATINTIAGKKLFISSPSATSVTKKCQSARIKVLERDFLIVDTPGLYDTELRQEETLNEIGKVMGLTSPGFHAFIIVVQVGRFTDEEKNTVDMLSQKFGPEFFKRAVVLFTRVDDIEEDGISFEQFVKERIAKELTMIIGQCGNRTVGFNNRSCREEKAKQVSALMMQLQKIMDSTQNTYYTNEIYKAVERQLQEEINSRRARDRSVTEEQVKEEIHHEIEHETGYWGRFKNRFDIKGCVIS